MAYVEVNISVHFNLALYLFLNMQMAGSSVYLAFSSINFDVIWSW